MPERADAILGTVLDGRYRVEAVLGAAHAGGTVFRGRDAGAGTTVVIRCPAIAPELSADRVALDAALETFVTEAETLARIGQGSNDVERLLASGVAESSDGTRVPYTIFEWLAGRALERHLADRAGNGSISEALIILEPAARALALAHSMGFAHRDVRPANLWLAETGGRTTLKVAAWGMATRIGPGDTAFAPEYGAPEHFKRSYGAVGPATDVYGLALCIIEMVTGKRALEGADAGELYLATSDLARRPTLRARGAHISDAVESVLQRALAVDPRRRWGSARELWDALIDAVPELSPAPPSVRMQRTSDRPPGITGGHAVSAGSGSGQESGPASVRDGAGRSALARSASMAPASVRGAEDARLVDSMRAAALDRSRAVDAQSGNSAGVAKARGDRTGTWAWAAVAALGVVGVAVVVAKVGMGAGAEAGVGGSAEAGGSGGAGPRGDAGAGTGARIDGGTGRASGGESGGEEEAVHVRPFLADMVRVPAGTFVMGSDRDGKGERPAHGVVLSRAFYIDRTEVRADAYAACVEEGTCPRNRVHALDFVETAYGCNNDKDKPLHPANCVDRLQAEKYCAFVHKRLPTEAEWEYAARGTDGREFPWGNTPPITCGTAILSGMTGPCGDRTGTWEVGTTADGKSAFGALDMAGNVWEWVADGYEPYPGSSGGDGGADGGAAVVDPKVTLPPQPSARGVLRGGSWDYAVASAKVTYRLPFVVTSSNVSIGFRCARDAE